MLSSGILADTAGADTLASSQSKPTSAAVDGVGNAATLPAITDELAASGESAAQDAQDAPRPGATIGRYQLIRELGHGGMGSVFLARDQRLGRLVAIKFLSVHNPTLSERFVAEVRTTAQCNHPNIVILYEADEHAGQPYMVLEFLQGKTLRAILHEHRATAPNATEFDEKSVAKTVVPTQPLLPVQRAVELIIPVLRGLERAHEMGIVHRDLKPANIMLTDSGSVKVLDFGIAKVLANDDRSARPSQAALRLNETGDGLTGTQGVIGTPLYMAPEQLGGGTTDARTDIWAIGIILYEMITGQHPLAPVTPSKLLALADLETPMPNLSAVRPLLGRLAPIVEGCLRKRAVERIGSASDLLADLEPLMASPVSPALSATANPFTGLSAFQESDADRFFGRSDDIANVVTRVRSQSLVAIIGPSGVGKSSLIRAGVIPLLKRSGEGWESIIIRPGRAPLAALAGLLGQLRLRTSTSPQFDEPDEPAVSARRAPTDRGDDGLDILTSSGIREVHAAEQRALIAQLTDEPGYLGAELRSWAERKSRKLVVFVDQFEEIYTLGGHARASDQRSAFLACLAGVADDASSPLRVMFSMRSDFLERMADNRPFMSAVTRGLLFLTPIDRTGLREALTRPVLARGYRFESPVMIEGMLDELEHTRGALPLMQFTASHLWDARDRNLNLLSQKSYDNMGGIAGTLARHADQTLAAMSSRQVRLARAIFERLVTPERTRAIASVQELMEVGEGDEDAAIEDVLHALADARLLVIEIDGESGTAHAVRLKSGIQSNGSVEIVHESLVASWPTLRKWLDENQDDAAFLAHLRTAAREWHASGRSPGMLWRGEPAREAWRWRANYTGALPERERHYLDEVCALLARNRRRRRALTYGTMTVLAVLLVVAAGVIFWVLRAQERVDRQSQTIERQQAQLDLQAELEVALKRAERAQDAMRRAKARALEEKARAEEEKARAEVERARAEAERARAESETASATTAAERAASATRRAETERARAESAATEAREAENRAREAERKARAAADAERATRKQLQALTEKQKRLLKRLGIKEPKL